MTTKNVHADAIGQAIILASMQASFGSVEMSSKFSVLSFSKDQDTLQRAADALTSYIIIGTLWAIGTCLVLYSEFGTLGLIYALAANILIMAWIVISYLKAFRYAADRNKLTMPELFSNVDARK